jgi:hypothetical protein
MRDSLKNVGQILVGGVVLSIVMFVYLHALEALGI